MADHEEMRGVKYGAFRGPTGRRRDLYSIVAQNYYHERAGSRFAYGRVGVRQAKKALHNDTPNRKRWLRFGIYNKTKGRQVK